MRLSVEQKITFAFGGALFVILFIFFSFYLSIQELNNAQKWVDHTLEVLGNFKQIEESLTSAESAQRGYQLTGDPILLSDYHYQVNAFRQHLAAAIQFSSDNAWQQQRFRELQPLIEQKIKFMEGAIATRKEGVGGEPPRGVSVIEGRNLREQIDAKINEMETMERRLLKDRESASGKRSDKTFINLGFAAFASLGLFGFTVYLVLRDLEQRRKSEEKQQTLLKALEKTNVELNDFAYVVSHDLKAPLRGITTLSSWLLNDYADKLDEQGKEQFRLLISRTKRMNDLIEGILAYSRVGRRDTALATVDLQELITQLKDSLAPPEGIRIEIKKTLPTIRTKRTQIEQIFQNLISNAIKYMGKPEGLIEIDYSFQDSMIVFVVRDDGPGIDPQYHAKIFQLFQTLAPQDKTDSTGVGLSIAKKMVENLGGKIWVESYPGDGSSFYFSLPKSVLEKI